jgi:hypothetical protein
VSTEPAKLLAVFVAVFCCRTLPAKEAVFWDDFSFDAMMTIPPLVSQYCIFSGREEGTMRITGKRRSKHFDSLKGITTAFPAKIPQKVA